MIVMLALLAAAGCAGTTVPGVGTAAPVDQGTPPTWAPSVREPRDARGIPACELLTEEQLVAVGLLPDTAVGADEPTMDSCGWSSATDDTNPAGLMVSTDTNLAALDIIYNLRENFERFEPGEIAGHPSVRADDLADNSCALYVAFADHQAVGIEYNLANRPLPDPCEVPRRMAEFILSNLPPLT